MIRTQWVKILGILKDSVAISIDNWKERDVVFSIDQVPVYEFHISPFQHDVLIVKVVGVNPAWGEGSEVLMVYEGDIQVIETPKAKLTLVK